MGDIKDVIKTAAGVYIGGKLLGATDSGGGGGDYGGGGGGSGGEGAGCLGVIALGIILMFFGPECPKSDTVNTKDKTETTASPSFSQEEIAKLNAEFAAREAAKAAEREAAERRESRTIVIQTTNHNNLDNGILLKSIDGMIELHNNRTKGIKRVFVQFFAMTSKLGIPSLNI